MAVEDAPDRQRRVPVAPSNDQGDPNPSPERTDDLPPAPAEGEAVRDPDAPTLARSGRLWPRAFGKPKTRLDSVTA